MFVFEASRFLWLTTISSNRLSFYKEELEGDTVNSYVHLRAATELVPPVEILERLVNETLDTIHVVNGIFAGDQEIARIWQEFVQVILLIYWDSPALTLRSLLLCATRVT